MWGDDLFRPLTRAAAAFIVAIGAPGEFSSSIGTVNKLGSRTIRVGIPDPDRLAYSVNGSVDQRVSVPLTLTLAIVVFEL